MIKNKPIWIEQAIEMRRDFKSNLEISETLSVSQSKVYKALRSFMDSEEHKNTKQSKKPNPRDNQMKILYQGGKTLEEIGKKYNVSRERVRQIMDKAGIEAGLAQKVRRKNKKERLVSKKNLVLKLLLEGSSEETILDQVNITKTEYSEIKNLLIKEKTIPPSFRTGQNESNFFIETRRKYVLKLREEGKNNKEIASILDVSKATVLRDVRALKLKGVKVQGAREHWNEAFLALERDDLYENIRVLRKQGLTFDKISKTLDQPLRKIMDRVSELRTMGEII